MVAIFFLADGPVIQQVKLSTKAMAPLDFVIGMSTKSAFINR
jgi:hypothetical protein